MSASENIALSLILGISFVLLIGLINARSLLFYLLCFTALMLMVLCLYFLLGIEFVGIAQGIVYISGFLILASIGVIQGGVMENFVAEKAQGIRKKLVWVVGLLFLGGGVAKEARAIEEKALYSTFTSLTEIGAYWVEQGGIFLEMVGILLLISMIGVVLILQKNP